jgi:hypothetical protein
MSKRLGNCSGTGAPRSRRGGCTPANCRSLLPGGDQLIEGLPEAILGYWTRGLINVFMKGVNSLVSAVIRRDPSIDC